MWGDLVKKSDSEGRVTLTHLSGTYTNMCERGVSEPFWHVLSPKTLMGTHAAE